MGLFGDRATVQAMYYRFNLVCFPFILVCPLYAGHASIEVISLSGSAYVKATPPKLDRFSRNLVAKGIFPGGSSNNSRNAVNHCHAGKSPIDKIQLTSVLLLHDITITGWTRISY